jgi:RNA polymerase sigma factor (sigma-70 family)
MKNPRSAAFDGSYAGVEKRGKLRALLSLLRPSGIPVLESASVGDDVLDRFRRGERGAFLEVYQAHAGDVRRWVGRFFSSPFEQEEAVQEIWLTTYRMQAGFDPARGALRPWLRTLAGNRCKELLRAKGRRPVDLDPIDDVADDLQTDAPGPEQQAQLARLRAAVDAFARTLPEDEAKVLTLGLIQEHTVEELAAALATNARRCKYLKKKLLERAASDPGLLAAYGELIR